METALIAIGVLMILILAVNLFSLKGKEQKTVGGSCQKCSEYRYCGGGRPRCARRSERK